MLSSDDKKNAIWNTASFIVSSFLSFLNYSIIFKTFDANIFGFFILVSSILGVGGNLDLGFGISTIKNLAEARKKNDTDFLNSYFNTFLIAFIFIGITIVLILTVYCLLILKNSELANTEGVKDLNFNLIIILLLITFFFNYLSGYLRFTMEGFSEYIMLSQITIASVIINTFLFLIIFTFKLNIYYLALFTLFSSIASFVIIYIYLFFVKHLVSFNPKLFDFKLVKKYSLYGINIQLSSFIGSLTDVIIKYLLGFYLSLSFVTYFESGKKIINFTNGLIFSTQRGLFVKLSEENIMGKLRGFVNQSLYYFSKMSNYYSILSYGLLNPLICFFIIFWFKSYESLVIYLIFSMSYTLINFAGCLYTVIMVEGKGLRLLLIQVLNVVLTYFLLMFSLNIFKSFLGLFGLYLSTIINVIIIFYYLYRSQGLEYKSYFSKIEISSIIKLNLLLLIQIVLVVMFPENLNYLLLLFVLIYSVVFLNQIRFFAKLLYSKVPIKFLYKKKF